MVIFLDTYAMVEIFEGNSKYMPYKSENSVTTRFNLFEFYYVVLSKYGKEKAEIVFKNYRNIAREVSDDTLKSAAEFKLSNKKKRLSFTDCIGYKYAESIGAKFLTGDYVFKDFPSVEFVQ
ncbi:MAG: PIN domain-containing protein [Nanoarchaeota archaeon]